MAPRICHGEGGFTYLAAMLTLVVISLLNLMAMESAGTSARREKEKQLLWVGEKYRQALRVYYLKTSGLPKRHPDSLDELLALQVNGQTLRPLRRAYEDPVTASSDWGVVTDGNGAIIGVFSKSAKLPIKQGGFEGLESSFSHARSYQDWKFIFDPAQI
jgi:type II secretory pathway pseudopilin PulG